MQVCFYALLDPDTKHLVYVGQTVFRNARRSQHLGSTADLRWSKAPIDLWCREKAKAANPPIWVDLGEIDLSLLPTSMATKCKKELERVLIRAFADWAIAYGRTLLNAHGNPYREHNTCRELVDFEVVEQLRKKTPAQLKAIVAAAAVDTAGATP